MISSSQIDTNEQPKPTLASLITDATPEIKAQLIPPENLLKIFIVELSQLLNNVDSKQLDGDLKQSLDALLKAGINSFKDETIDKQLKYVKELIAFLTKLQPADLEDTLDKIFHRIDPTINLNNLQSNKLTLITRIFDNLEEELQQFNGERLSIANHLLEVINTRRAALEESKTRQMHRSRNRPLPLVDQLDPLGEIYGKISDFLKHHYFVNPKKMDYDQHLENFIINLKELTKLVSPQEKSKVWRVINAIMLNKNYFPNDETPAVPLNIDGTNLVAINDTHTHETACMILNQEFVSELKDRMDHFSARIAESTNSAKFAEYTAAFTELSSSLTKYCEGQPSSTLPVSQFLNSYVQQMILLSIKARDSEALNSAERNALLKFIETEMHRLFNKLTNPNHGSCLFYCDDTQETKKTIEAIASSWIYHSQDQIFSDYMANRENKYKLNRSKVLSVRGDNEDDRLTTAGNIRQGLYNIADNEGQVRVTTVRSLFNSFRESVKQIMATLPWYKSFFNRQPSKLFSAEIKSRDRIYSTLHHLNKHYRVFDGELTEARTEMNQSFNDSLIQLIDDFLVKRKQAHLIPIFKFKTNETECNALKALLAQSLASTDPGKLYIELLKKIKEIYDDKSIKKTHLFKELLKDLQIAILDRYIIDINRTTSYDFKMSFSKTELHEIRNATLNPDRKELIDTMITDMSDDATLAVQRYPGSQGTSVTPTTFNDNAVIIKQLNPLTFEDRIRNEYNVLLKSIQTMLNDGKTPSVEDVERLQYLTTVKEIIDNKNSLIIYKTIKDELSNLMHLGKLMSTNRLTLNPNERTKLLNKVKQVVNLVPEGMARTLANFFVDQASSASHDQDVQNTKALGQITSNYNDIDNMASLFAIILASEYVNLKKLNELSDDQVKDFARTLAKNLTRALSSLKDNTVADINAIIRQCHLTDEVAGTRFFSLIHSTTSDLNNTLLNQTGVYYVDDSGHVEFYASARTDVASTGFRKGTKFECQNLIKVGSCSTNADEPKLDGAYKEIKKVSDASEAVIKNHMQEIATKVQTQNIVLVDEDERNSKTFQDLLQRTDSTQGLAILNM